MWRVPGSLPASFVESPWDVYLIEQATRRPQRPSAFIGMVSAGFGEIECYEFDMAMEAYAVMLDLRRHATEKKSKPTHQSNTIDVPKYSTLAELIGLRVDGYNEDDTDDSLNAAQAAIVDRISNVSNTADIPDLLELLGVKPPERTE
jgi:hypothetical protein